MIELGRWGMDLQKLEDVVGLAPSSLPNALRVILRPPADAAATLALRSERPVLRAAHRRRLDRRLARRRPRRPTSTLAGSPIEVIAALVAGEAGEEGVEVEGDRELLDELRAMVVIPERLREEALAAVRGSGLRQLLLVELDDVHGAVGRGVDAEACRGRTRRGSPRRSRRRPSVVLEDVDGADFLELRRRARRRRRPRRRPRRR